MTVPTEQLEIPANPVPNHIQDFIFVRELCEVYLLLDHISGRWDKSLPQREAGAPHSNDSVSVQAICEIGWPVVGNNVEQAKQASTLLHAKDKLNATAKPANGATIAFTLMVVGEENSPVDSPRVERKADQADPNSKGWLGEYKSPPTRMYLAHRAFPGLINSAKQFRFRVACLLIFLVTFLLLTCLLSWYVAAGNIILTHLDTVHAQERDIRKKVGLMMPARSSELEADDPALSARACKLYVLSIVDPLKAAELFHLCDSLEEKDFEHAAIGASLGGWLMRMASTAKETKKIHASNEEFSRIFTQLLVSSVLPFFYGVLGAGAAIVRDLWAKMRESLLAPRDFTLALGQLALGAVIGACISLFISPSVAGAPNENTLGSFILTGSALSFVAGFGVEGAFQALESLVRRVFNSQDPTRK